MSLLDIPWAASSTISRSRPDSGSAAAMWSSPGVTAPSQVAARMLDRRSAAAVPGVAGQERDGMPGADRHQRRVARAGQLAQPG
jgi:hypothetical protein